MYSDGCFEEVALKDGISIFTATMNRTENLIESLKTWINLTEISEIIILDWSSVSPVYPAVNQLKDNRIRLIRVNCEDKWILSYAFNLASRFTSYNTLFKIDADVKVHPDFFKQHKLLDGEFFAGNYRNARIDNERFLNGTFLVRREDFLSVGGYNEFIQFYGHDDEDLYNRLQNAGLRRLDVNNDFLSHIPHESRHINQEAIWTEMNISEKEIATMKNLCNMMLVNNFLKWGTNEKSRKYQILEKGLDYVVCTGDQKDTYTVPKNFILQAEEMAFRDRMKRETLSIHHSFIDRLSLTQLKIIYSALFNKDLKSRNNEIVSILSSNFFLSFSNGDDKDIIILKEDNDKLKRLLIQKNELIRRIEKSPTFRIGKAILWPIKSFLKIIGIRK